MEYLMTYGWAILIIAVVLGALFRLGVFNANNFAPKAPPGSCQVFRPYGPGTTQFINLEGICSGELPEYAAYFTPASNSHIDTSSFIPLYKRSFTVTAWINSPRAAEGPYDISVFGEGNSTKGCSTDTCMHLVIRSDKIYFGFFGDDISGSKTLADNTWYFVAWVYNITNNYKYIYLYGRGYSGLDNAGPSSNSFQLTSGTTCIGSEMACNGAWFNGTIANVQIYNTSLPSNEIQALYLEGIGGAPIDLQHLVAWYPLNGDANDYSGNGNNGVPTKVKFVSNWWSGYTPP
ncbi:MAG: LamG-like jellyroll fold domain-containing protein [Candidatus Micrarchaeia archaeon]